ncbi:MAG: hypothetical protein PHD76_00740 [Methylacidiphilales bacterium]|nr:hypothetical protein [Candidatus Methylacidiphilales bacterium]
MSLATVELLTPTEARKNLSRVLGRVSKGANLGIVFKNEVFVLRPTKVIPDYVFKEYGITPDEMKRITARLDDETKEKMAGGKTVRWTGSVKRLVRDRV